jgi:hypothetical protein
MPPFCFGVRSPLESFSCETMKVSIDGVTNREFEIEEVSAGVDRLRGTHSSAKDCTLRKTCTSMAAITSFNAKVIGRPLPISIRHHEGLSNRPYQPFLQE